MLVDRAEIHIRAGDGGNGCVSFRRERFVPKGGPDGGDGGLGGSVLAEACDDVATLLDFNGRHHWTADNGRPGMGKNRSGKSGEDLVLRLPIGTLIYDRETGILLKDLTVVGERVCLAEGGKGGKGNARFARPTHQVPREFEEGVPGQQRSLRLELKLIADVGLVGLPNAGKSTLLSRLSRARPKIADYPFTTLHPQLGIVELSGHRRLIVADIPGLIEGAHEGAGLGDAFLRHIERTRIIVHLIDAGSDLSLMPPAVAYQTIRDELAKYSALLAEKPEIIVANKADLTDAMDGVEELRQATGQEVLAVSAVTGTGIPDLVECMWARVKAEKDRTAQAAVHTAAVSPPPQAVEPNNVNLVGASW